MNKILLLLSTLIASNTCYAFSKCAGETYSGYIVEVMIDTVGTMGFVKGGKVDITDDKGNRSTYKLEKNEITQFYESDETANGGKAFVGLLAFQDNNNPISIHYYGTNFEQDDLVSVLRKHGRKKEIGNRLTVWKGPGYNASEQFNFQDVVCSLFFDP